MTLAENLAREDLTPAEEAAGLAVLVRQHGWSLRQVAEAVHKSPAYVSLRLRVFETEDLRAPVLEEKLSISAAEELLRVPPDLRPDLVDDAVREQWTPAQARRARLTVRMRCLESKRAGKGPPAMRLEERFRVLSADLQTIEPAQVSRAARREAKRLLAILHELID
jgi:ParB family chromosome partitioning protein